MTGSELEGFEEFMVTDALKPKEHEDMLRIFEEADDIVAVDPECRSNFTAVFHNQAAMGILHAPFYDNAKNEVISFGKR